MVGPRSPELQPRTDAPNEWGRGGTSFSDELGWSWSWVRDALVLSRVPRWGGWSTLSGWNGNPPCSLPAANVIQMSPARPAAGARREHIPHPAAGATLPRAAPESWRGGGTHHLGRLPCVCVWGVPVEGRAALSQHLGPALWGPLLFPHAHLPPRGRGSAAGWHTQRV